MRKDLPYWIGLNEHSEFGPQAMKRLFSYFKDMKLAFEASKTELIKAGITPKKSDSFLSHRPEINIERLLKRMKNYSISAVTVEDENYPSRLKTIYDPPAVLFYRGTLLNDSLPHIAIVGSRKASSYGLRCAKEFASKFANQNIVVVSGLAYGIDQAAHRATVEAGGKTIAVLGCGLLGSLTGTQRYVAQNIIEGGGAIYSEFPLEICGLKHHYPYRNRVISGLCSGTLIIEATERSGSILTAKSAIDQNRDVFCVPGPIDSETSKGTNILIRDGAAPALSPKDVLLAMSIETKPAEDQIQTPISKIEQGILAHLSRKPIHIDELVRNTDLNAPALAQSLSLLELKGRVQQIGGMYYIAT